MADLHMAKSSISLRAMDPEKFEFSNCMRGQLQYMDPHLGEELNCEWEISQLISYSIHLGIFLDDPLPIG